jgi:hypothetical protein
MKSSFLFFFVSPPYSRSPFCVASILLRLLLHGPSRLMIFLVTLSFTFRSACLRSHRVFACCCPISAHYHSHLQLLPSVRPRYPCFPHSSFNHRLPPKPAHRETWSVEQQHLPKLLKLDPYRTKPP